MCHVRLLKKHLQIRTSSTSSLFAHLDGTGLTRYQFSSVLQKTLSFCEIRDHYRSHSFRIGGATQDKRLGVDDETIKKWGRWTSDAYLKYFRLDM
jgi:site-specific recombinase XerD